MKLKKVTSNDRVTRVTVGLHESVLNNMKAYQGFYQKKTGDEISFPLLVEEMLKGFIGEDKEFARYVADRAKAEGAQTKDGQSS